MALPVLLAVGIATTTVILVLAIGLMKHLKLLSGSLRRFRDEVQPLLEEIQDASERARSRTDTLTDRGAKLADPVERRRLTRDRKEPAAKRTPDVKLPR